MKKLLTLLALAFYLHANAQIITTVAGTGNGVGGFSGDGGQAISAELYDPTGVFLDGSGNVFIADYANQRIRKVDGSTGIISTIAGNGTSGFAGDGGQATSAELHGPMGVFVDGSGNVFILDYFNNRIRKVNGSTGIITTIVGNGTGGYAGDGGAATSAEIWGPWGLFVDGSGNVFIADEGNQRIRKVDGSTGIITTIAGNGTLGYAGDGAAATSAELNAPYGIFVDGSGNVFISDYQNNRVRKVNSSTGIITTIAGNGTQGYSGDGAAATSAELYWPTGVFVDGSGNVFIADEKNNRIRKVNGSTGIITTIAGNGAEDYSGDGAAATSAELSLPSGVFVDGSGNVFIADQSNNRIREVYNCGSISNFPNITYTLTNVSPHIWDAYPTYSSNVDSAKWYWGDGTSTTGLYPSHTYSVAGRYNICVTAYTSCGDSAQSCQNDTVYRASNSSMVSVNVISSATGISQISGLNSNISIYPNPNNGLFVIEPNSATKQTMQVYDVNGKLVLSQPINGKTSIDAGTLNEGVYNISLQSNEGVVNKRLVIVR